MTLLNNDFTHRGPLTTSDPTHHLALNTNSPINEFFHSDPFPSTTINSFSGVHGQRGYKLAEHPQAAGFPEYLSAFRPVLQTSNLGRWWLNDSSLFDSSDSRATDSESVECGCQ